MSGRSSYPAWPNTPQTQRPSRRLGPGEPLLEQVVRLRQVLAQPPSDRGQGDAAAGALEQRHAEPPLLPGDGLADAGLRDVQTLGGTAEVQLFCERQEDLDVPQLHG
ncbi:hypothetical protein GCM10020001_109260 [Nonomuraea salmonea]